METQIKKAADLSNGATSIPQLVTRSESGQAITTSLKVAEYFGKEHRHVLDTIRELVRGCAENSADPLFEEATYTHPQNGQSYPLFFMNRDGFSLLVMGFTGKEALKFKLDFIDAFNKMEAELKAGTTPLDFSNPDVVAKLAADWAAETKKRIAAETKLLAQAPKVAYADAVVSSKSSCLIGEFAKVLAQNGFKIGQNRLFAWLRANGYLGKNGERRNVPNQLYIEQGLFTIKRAAHTDRKGVTHVSTTTKVTGKGQIHLAEKLIKGGLGRC